MTTRLKWLSITALVIILLIIIAYFAGVRVYIINGGDLGAQAAGAGPQDMTGEWARSVGGPTSWNNGSLNDSGFVGTANAVAQRAQRLCGGCSGVGLLPGNTGIVVTWKTKTPPAPAPNTRNGNTAPPLPGGNTDTSGNASGNYTGSISLPSTVTGGTMGNIGGYSSGLFWFDSSGFMSQMQAPKGN